MPPLRSLLAGCLVSLTVAAPALAHPEGAADAISGRQLVTQVMDPQNAFPRRAEPPLRSVPRAQCRPGDRVESGMQGRVTAEDQTGAAKDGLWCNADLLAHDGDTGGLKVRRYVDETGRECAYFDTTLLYPLNAFTADSTSQGVTVLDMSDPTKPVQTAQLVTPAMLSPHESLVLSEKRGLLVAVMGNASTYAGIIDIYDVSQDCRTPVLQSSTPTGILGHESGLAPDGRTFYSASPFSKSVVAVDIENPKVPRVLGAYNIASHGLSVSEDGNRIYVAAVNTGTGPSGLEIWDTSEIQARKANPQVRKVSALTWATVSIPQNAIPVTIKGKPYVLEIDEFRKSSGPPVAGVARIIDISDETKPRVVSDIRLEVHDPDKQRELANDPGQANRLQGYAGHYCDVPRVVDPDIVACSFILSGLRVFDIRDPAQPKEVAYYVAPAEPKTENRFDGSNYAMSAPAFSSSRREVWYTDGTSGFYSLRLADAAWPTARGAVPERRCRSRRVIRIRTKKVRGFELRRVVAYAGGKVVGRSRGRRVTTRFTGFEPGPVTVRLRLTGKRRGKTVTITQLRTFRLCVPKGRG